ncbi:MAG: MopE-related protein [Proteobacteria bacterium]|nr:MopE-related protein [Pseudomonadota bacterium]
MNRRSSGGLVALGSITAFAALASCDVNEYCINCATGDAGPHGDAMADANDAGMIDAPDASTCVVTGVEVCDGVDNDCDGQTDNGTLPEVGDACANQQGECAGGIKQCTAGHLVCSKPPMPEICDGKDNNCNGAVDEGDPGGGGTCGTNVGECTAGIKHCNLTTHVVDCEGAIGSVGGQPEICNGRDDDCDGSFDEGLTNLGACGSPMVGACHPGTLSCQGGGPVCSGSQDPVFEACDNIDNDCDNAIDEDYNKLTDPRNCLTCGHVCTADHAISGCAGGACTIASCQAGYHDNNGLLGDGCEYGPCQANGTEVCDGVDNDCDGLVDNNLTAPAGLCKTVGECTGSFATCSGAGGWVCNYGATVSTDPTGSIVAETTCDTLDNDCDTAIDENQPNKGLACTDAGIGICQGTGTFTCDAGNLDGPAICTITTPGQTATTEACDGKDNNCDGIVDNTTGPDRVIDAMSHVVYGAFDFYMDTYEASRPDAASQVQGALASRACSNPGVQPWRNVSFAAATAACAAAGKVLCTGAQWGAACEGATNTTYPYGNTFGASTCNTESNDGDAVLAGDQDVLLDTNAKVACLAAQGPKDLSGNLKEWTDDITGVTSGGKNIAVLRGGAYDTPSAGATCDFRLTRAAVNVLEDTNGFRCCKATAP